MQLRDKSVKDSGRGAVAEEVRVKEVLSFEDSFWILFLDQVVQAIC